MRHFDAIIIGAGQAGPPLAAVSSTICVDAETKQLLRAAILGVGGDEVIRVLLDVMYAKAHFVLP
jgi:hypothetical protein